MITIRDTSLTAPAAKRLGDWFTTASGKQFWPLDARFEDIDIADIAHALARVCRFGGHCREFYSVAQHSVLVCDLVTAARPHDRHVQLQALLHDATEAYMGDMVQPLKASMPDYKRAEEELWKVIAAKFGVQDGLNPLVKHMDYVALQTERRDLLPETGHVWWTDRAGIPCADVKIRAQMPVEAALCFIHWFEGLTSGNAKLTP